MLIFTKKRGTEKTENSSKEQQASAKRYLKTVPPSFFFVQKVKG